MLLESIDFTEKKGRKIKKNQLNCSQKRREWAVSEWATAYEISVFVSEREQPLTNFDFRGWVSRSLTAHSQLTAHEFRNTDCNHLVFSLPIKKNL